MNLGRIDWLWLAIGLLLGVFIIPMMQAWWANRSGNASD